MNNRVAQLIVVSALLLTGGIAHAQIIGQIEADIPFTFGLRFGLSAGF
jgi:hypothetical protein